MLKQKSHISSYISSLRKQGAVILLESQMENHPASRKSYLAAQPKAWIKAYGNEIQVMENGVLSKDLKNPWKALEEFQQRQEDWLFGFLGYDLKNNLEELKSKNPALIDAPDLFFMVPEFLLEIDDDNIVQIKGELPEEISESDQNEFELEVRPIAQISEQDYLKMVERAKLDIFEGDYYEINLSHPLEFEVKGDSWQLYEAMKKAGPVPFGGYAKIDNFALCCSSPERFLAREGNRIWSQPIKGTASRQKNSDSKRDIEKLKYSDKERAENLMIVDLVRNDLNRVAAKNTVKVLNLFEIQSFETVHQMVSTVECRVEIDTKSIEVIKACFPMGSMTGAPKIASMKAIEKYENYKRGIYSGALGYIKPNGDFDFNVVIRTAVINNEKMVYPVGGAITSDSDPKLEWDETHVKARAITNIFQNVK